MIFYNNRIKITTFMVIVYSLAYSFWFFYFKGDEKLNDFDFEGSVFSLIAPIMAALFIYINIQRIKGQRKKYWILLMFNCFIFFLAELVWTCELLSRTLPPFPRWSDLLWFINLGLFLFAVLYRVYTDKEKYRLWQLWFEACIVVTFFLTVCWIYLLKPVFFEISLTVLPSIVSFSYSFGYLCILLGIIFVYVFYQKLFPHKVFILHLSTFFIYLIFAPPWLYQSVFYNLEYSPSLAEPLWSISLALMGLSSFFEEETEKKNEEKRGVTKVNRLIIPYISVVILIILGFYNGTELKSIFTGLTVILVLMMARHLIILRENDRILENVVKLNETLEDKVKERTAQVIIKNEELSYLNNHLEEIVGNRTHQLEKTKKKLIESEQRYRSLFENHPHTIVLFDSEGEYLQVNRFKTNLINEQKELSITQLDQSYPTHYFEKALQGAPQSFETTIEVEEHSCVNYMVTFVPVLADKKVIGIFGIYEDVTDRKRTEELVRKSEKLEIVSHLAASMSHEVRNPLTTARGFIQLLSEDVAMQKGKPYLEIVIQEIDRATEIINHYLTFAKPAPVIVEKVDVLEVVQSTIKIITPLSNMNAVQISLSYSHQSDHFIRGERKKLQQCLVNILKNGIEAMPNGGELHLHLISSDIGIQIEIRDTGIGMTPTQLNRLGEPYFSTKGQKNGTGLGMMVAFSTVKGMNGQIRVTSEVEKGTCFFIQFPAYHNQLSKADRAL